MHSLFVSALFFQTIFIFPTSYAANCKPRAISLPFKSNVLVNRAQARGVSWQIGSPNAQTIALFPSASYNDTYLYGATGLCATNVTLEKCTTFRGGLFNGAQSESDTVGASIKHPYDDATASWTTDKVVLQDSADKSIDLGSHEFGLRAGTSHEYVNKGELGLGKNSTFLSALSSGQKIASSTYSFFWGTDAAISDNPRNGSLTLGGYDQALVGDAKNTTTKFTRNNWRCREGMIVELTGLALQSEGGGTQNIMDETETMQACVVPTLSSVLTLPTQYWNKTADLMGAKLSPLNGGFSGALFYHLASVRPNTATFNGNLSITINKALTITIPNKQLIFDEPYIAPNGLIMRNKDWKNIPIVRYTDLDQNMPRLGGMFLSSAYLMVNHDKDEFTISGVQETPAAQKLVGIDTTNSCIANVEGGTTAVPEPSTPASHSSSDSKALSGGAIAGIVVGILALIALIAGIAFLAWRRRKIPANVQYKAELAASHDGVALVENDRARVVEKYGYSVSELYAGQRTGELPGHASEYVVELDGRSKPAEAPVYGAERDFLMTERR
ncbi:hypothetical protein CC86DRAFT_21950 [Ophiobolus disseminans]|uniref:Acid protease n=1 Tax=Ophiobolus disseminans TaxID=1469910 RepID=A0A6A7A2A0_9PLEO|nr:hypothetical protein CC86DRAFT_21950 [Ophiobolus disseminans]